MVKAAGLLGEVSLLLLPLCLGELLGRQLGDLPLSLRPKERVMAGKAERKSDEATEAERKKKCDSRHREERGKDKEWQERERNVGRMRQRWEEWNDSFYQFLVCSHFYILGLNPEDT